MKFVRSASIALCFAGMFAFSSAPAFAKPEFAKKEQATCPTCHVMSAFPKRNGYKDLAACKKDPKTHRATIPK